MDESGTATGDVDQLADEVGIYSLNKIVPIDVNIVVIGRQFCRVVVTEILRLKKLYVLIMEIVRIER